MKNKREKIDSLLIANADAQLGRFDWQRLNSSISDSLDEISGARPARPMVYKLFAGTGVAAAVLLTIFILNLNHTRGPALEPGRTAAVELISTKAAGIVTFSDRTSGAFAIVELNPRSVGRSEVSFASASSDVICELEIFDSNATMKKVTDRPSWIIINLHKSSVAEAETQNDHEEIFWMM